MNFMSKTSIHITSGTLNLQECYSFVQDASCGGIALFVGTVRNSTKNKTVTLLDFSGYEPMAIKEMQKIANTALEKFSIHKIAIHHALGNLNIGDIPVIIAVSSAHRNAAFEACQFAIDTLKETVPIWKKEHFEDGEVWVNSHP
jgi:molybdopterin synthase catalytic subunit